MSKPTDNIIKIRDDIAPVYFEDDGSDEYRVTGDSKPSWVNQNTFTRNVLRKHVEPWLTALFQSEHLSLLTGSGLTNAIHLLATGEKSTGMGSLPLNTYATQINTAALASSQAANRKDGNIEDQIRAANELLRGLEILSDTKATALKAEIETGLKNFAESILNDESSIAKASATTSSSQEEKETKAIAFNTLVTFLMSFASRTGVRDRLNIFTTNYDRLIEAGAELAGIHLMDRFLGNLMPIFRSSRLDLDMHYNPPGIRGEPRYLEGVARFTKLHGSVDWLQTANNEIRRMGLPFGAEEITPYLQAPGFYGGEANKIMIYPNAAKDQETAGYPYVELFRDFAAGICRPNSTLVTYGYGFGDDHINRVILDMLTIPSTHLVIISYDDPLGRITKLFESSGRKAQISLLIGPALADISSLTQHYLPKPAIDKTTSRMTDLLKQRFVSNEQSKQVPNDTPEGPNFL